MSTQNPHARPGDEPATPSGSTHLLIPVPAGAEDAPPSMTATPGAILLLDETHPEPGEANPAVLRVPDPAAPMACWHAAAGLNGTGIVMVRAGDRIEDVDAFLSEAESFVGDDPPPLLVTLPEVILTKDEERKPQYDRRPWDGRTGHELLVHLVETGEMGLLTAGTWFDRADVLEGLPDPVLGVAGEMVLLARLCARHPGRRLRVTRVGAYLRRVETSPVPFQPEDLAFHLAGVVTAAYHLLETGGTDLGAVISALRKRGEVLQQVYGIGREGVRVFVDLLEGRPLEAGSQEADAVLHCLDRHWDALPEECRVLFGRAVQEAPGSASPDQDEARVASLAAVIEAIESENFREAEEALERHRIRYGEDPVLPSLEANLALAMGDRRRARRTLSRTLVTTPDHFDALHLLGNLTLDEGDLDGAVRLYTRALRDANEAQLQRLAPSWQRSVSMGASKPVLSPRVAFLVAPNVDQFLDDITASLVSAYEVRKFVVRNQEDVVAAMEWADVCWFEWCDQALVYGSNHPLAREKTILCRIHRYEAFTDFPTRVRWERVDHVILVTGHLRYLLRQRVPDLENRTDLSVVKNGVDLTAFPFRERQPGHHLAFIGYLHLRKNPMMLLQILARLVELDPCYRLSLAGTFQDDLTRLYWEYMVREMDLEDHIRFDGWQQDIAAWLEDKDYLVSTSIHESFGYAIAEGMARGIKPVVHNFPFAHEIWAEEMLFNTVDEAIEMITSAEYESATYRAFIERHYSLDRQVREVRALLDRLTSPASAPVVSRPAINLADAGTLAP